MVTKGMQERGRHSYIGGCTVVAKMLFGDAPLLLSSFKKVRHSYYKGVHGGAPCFQGV